MNIKIPLALLPLSNALNILSRDLFEEGIRLSRLSPRKRIILPIHKTADASMHRMLNFIQPDSYIRPHNHSLSNKTESVIVLQGAIHFFTFEEDGSVKTSTLIGGASKNFGVDIEPSIYHAFFALEPDTIIFETKPGPYDKATDKLFATWAPEEDTAKAQLFMKQLLAIPKS